MKSFGLIEAVCAGIGLILAGCAQHKQAEAAETRREVPAPISEPSSRPVEHPEPSPPAAESQPDLKPLFPGIRADIRARLVELDGVVPINCHDPATPDVYLELVVCAPDTREHESLVVTRAKPSHLHAALLAIGLKPGRPGSWKVEAGRLVALPPNGDPLDVTITYRHADGTELTCPIADWVMTAGTHRPFVPLNAAAPRWLFAGSVFVMRQGNEVYDADGAGTIVGLTTFGSEVVAWRDTISPEASIDTPEWIADPSKVPAAGTPVIVRFTPAQSR